MNITVKPIAPGARIYRADAPGATGYGPTPTTALDNLADALSAAARD